MTVDQSRKTSTFMSADRPTAEKRTSNSLRKVLVQSAVIVSLVGRLRKVSPVKAMSSEKASSSGRSGKPIRAELLIECGPSTTKHETS